MKTLAAEAEVDREGWLKIRTPAPPEMAPGRQEVLLVWASPAASSATAGRRAGTLSGQVVLAPDFHAPLEDFRPYSK
ncbi:MAG TPA: hypothetical protein PKI20_01670 [Verrucomicrobiota bacterium]|nr:hypothetical protein [Verrucomicrobiota bacterium]HQL78365.1 hypothetical protein [Verrucomicrobiota bacterium]